MGLLAEAAHVTPIHISLVSCSCWTEAELTGLYQTALKSIVSAQADPAIRCIVAVRVLRKSYGAVGDDDIGADLNYVMAVMYCALGAERPSALITSYSLIIFP